MAARQAAASQRGTAASNVYYQDEIDPEQIFNMFFGGGQFGAGNSEPQSPPPPLSPLAHTYTSLSVS